MTAEQQAADDLLTYCQVLLDQMDYTAGNCQVNEMVGAVVSTEVLTKLKDAMRNYREVRYG